MHPRIKSLATNFVLALASILVVLVGTEVFLRLFPQVLPIESRMRLQWAQPDSADVTRADPFTGFVYAPHLRHHYSAGEVTFDYSTDEYGFRNPSPWPDSADIVVVGDSEVFGFGVSDDSMWTNVLQHELPHTRVINLGLSMMAPEQYRRVYEKFGARVHPKLLIFGLFPENDLSDQVEFDKWLAAGSPGNFAKWKYVHGATPSRLQSLLQRSALYWFVYISRHRDHRSNEVKPQTFADGSQLHFAPYFLQREARLSTPKSAAFQSVMRSIEQCREEAARNGTAMLVIMLSTREDVYLPLRGDSVPRLMAPFANALAERGIPYLDLTAPMQRVAREGKRLFFEVDLHPDAAGSRVIADAVAANIRQNAAAYHLRLGGTGVIATAHPF